MVRSVAEVLLEQLGHTVWGFGVVVLSWLALGLPGAPAWAPYAGFGVGVLVFLPRELIDQWPIERPSDTALDLFFFGVGGALGTLPAVVG